MNNVEIVQSDLEMVFRKKSGVEFEEKDGLVRIVKHQNHWSQRFLRTLGLTIPLVSYMELDDYGSTVFRLINGATSVQEMGEMLAEEHEGAQEQLYERLLRFLWHMENVERWIEAV